MSKDERLTMRKTFIRCAVAVLASMGLPAVALSSTLQEVKSAGRVKCGVNPDLTGCSRSDSLGEYSGFDVDLCRAVAAAVLGVADRVEFIAVTATGRFNDLVANKYHVLLRNTTWTLQRDTSYGQFVGVTYYDGQGFMVLKLAGLRSALELDDIGICVSHGSTTELNAIDFFKVSDIRDKPVFFEDETDAAQAYQPGECGA